MIRPAFGIAAQVAWALCVAGSARAQDSASPPRPAATATAAPTAAAPAPTVAADSALDVRTAAVAATLRCPVCQGESIQASPSELAQQMRSVVRDRLRAGDSPDQIRAYFVSKYGEWILLEPAMTGLNILLYLFPVLLVVGGLVLTVVLVRRWTTPGTNTPGTNTPGTNTPGTNTPGTNTPETNTPGTDTQ